MSRPSGLGAYRTYMQDLAAVPSQHPLFTKKSNRGRIFRAVRHNTAKGVSFRQEKAPIFIWNASCRNDARPFRELQLSPVLSDAYIDF